MPQSRSGKWSVGFGIVLVISMAFSLIFAFAIGGDSAVIEGNLLLSIFNVALNLILNLSGLLSFVIGIYTIVKHKEWSVCKYLAVLYGLALLMFVLGEFIFPH
ncbi:MAG: hypothetical protein A2747_01295 [Candidatus Yonathbacteria bacterium RIFCSPHIGHO2_01_FULL_44_41]|uniref:Uncharacterized protein n=1 Tax=Candidatus Yonathbacteria bacterium RIFCSPHIGHO2_02_FULL_44_14 TaxID=1802724 RepID=A0A1G2S8P2_9BACT|nr:MAG: hypothetical protein A2747_01295 [Candidatus Yonathbacteria bacterium RIFCSPHIGHO2_01_FULL_44_41]OHA80942.1 MAG: hypothetical protein A3D51_02875 [Candidatus Yonathbacteria bacterium RIFCSPHIGHO2_02_FULL_44_14]OHA82375.1 MAG: hypothetical protein A3B06_00515 [Candidatus Yonathbacteria bacterium RIFCSPLOWO2_01_FULL_43_20]